MMKRLSLYTLLFSMVVFLGSCDKESELEATVADVNTSEQAFLKINYVSAYVSNPSVQLELNEKRISNLLTPRTPFPGGGYNTGGGNSNDYLVVNPGQMSVKVAIPNRNTASDSIVLFRSSLNLSAGKYYSAHITDTGVNTKIVVLEDNRSLPDTGRSRYRFVNLMPNVPSVDLYYGTTLMAAGVAYLNSSSYFEVLRPATSLAWTIREAGASPTSTGLATYTSGNTTIDQRVYTVFASGYKGGTAARLPFVAFYLIN